ncbi:MAG: hypothetical protein BJ554DRAFT_6294 [Olpidium bornovanus]|uniref:Uncharacterized protein n=1 Tax=Olpidium bornovanus TaxID=278681 RepID=A0A8H8A278_9FUNG|nr:MAG: hypothetical protein BJ554DRAFT_6294 [Olpidium bornovanus]
MQDSWIPDPLFRIRVRNIHKPFPSGEISGLPCRAMNKFALGWFVRSASMVQTLRVTTQKVGLFPKKWRRFSANTTR